MTFKNLFRQSVLAMLLAFVSTSVMAQEKKSTKEIDWFQELKSRITLNGYAQAASTVMLRPDTPTPTKKTPCAAERRRAATT